MKKDNNELTKYSEEQQKEKKLTKEKQEHLKQNYRKTKNNDILNELSKQMTVLSKYGQYTTERRYNNSYCRQTAYDSIS